MTDGLYFSEDSLPLDWSEATNSKPLYGPKGAMLAVLPRAWTLPFVLIPSSLLSDAVDIHDSLLSLGEKFFLRALALAGDQGKLIVRSSVVGESIWDRGSYESLIVQASKEDFARRFIDTVTRVRASTAGKPTGLVIQRYIRPRARGEFGNLLRISKTRDQWELSEEGADDATSRIRFNTQRDEAASVNAPLHIRPRLTRERLFGSIAAWLNTYLLRGRSQRLNCEWVSDHKQIYIVQVDEEDEDLYGINPFQLYVSPTHTPKVATGRFLAHASGSDKLLLKQWDKLKVLDELWEGDVSHRPMLFYLPLARLPRNGDAPSLDILVEDFCSLIGPDNIVIRTSVRGGAEKLLNLPRTECLSPKEAACWCLQTRDRLVDEGASTEDLAFVVHRFIGARASAWARAEPGNPVIEIHGLWGLPDALQYCPYDTWEVHLPTEVATEYPEYKSNILIPESNGKWKHVRVKNELARHLCISGRQAVELAKRSAAISKRLQKPCHIMWFIDCVGEGGAHFSIPWYWAAAHEAERNMDRSNYRITVVSDRQTLERFAALQGPRTRQAIELRPVDPDLMRDSKFIEAVGRTAHEKGVPVILAGSTLAHAYYQLRRQGCTVVTPSQKEHSRIRRSMTFGKIVRDKIPNRIAQRQEAEITRAVPTQVAKGFLVSKVLEEALELRNATDRGAKVMELADLFEVIRALARADNIPVEEVISEAEGKRKKSGGFDDGLVLLQTGILGREREDILDHDRHSAQLLARRIAADAYEVPFTFFGFMEMNKVRSIVFDELGMRLDVMLKGDRIELRLSQEAEQLDLPLDLSLPGESGPKSV